MLNSDIKDRGAGSSLAGFLSAIPDLAFGGTFLVTWISPQALGDGMVKYLMLVMLLEFFIVHSSAFMGAVMVSEADADKKSLRLLGLSAFYSIFIGAFAAFFQTWSPFLTF